MTNKTLISTYLTLQLLKSQGSYWLRHPHKPRPYFPMLGNMVHLPVCVMNLFCHLPDVRVYISLIYNCTFNLQIYIFIAI